MLSLIIAYVQYRVPEWKVRLIHRAIWELQSSFVQDMEAAERNACYDVLAVRVDMSRIMVMEP